MIDRTPLMIVGDGPQEASGLGRILRDLAWRIVASDLPVEVVTVGGPVPPVWRAWPHFPLDERLHRGEDWGRSYVEQLYRSYFGTRPGILWVIWDAGRLAAYHGIDLPVRIWSYPAIDGEAPGGGVNGPAGAALAAADRVIAYGRWASQVIKRGSSKPVPYLPHGIDTRVGEPAEDALVDWARAALGPYVQQADRVIGCVATNQSRKDLSLFCETLAELRQRGHAVFGWLHTDVLVKAWSIPQLVEDFGLVKRITVSLVEYSEAELAALYQQCSVTIAPGLGEGFGYPIVESLLHGVPVVHGDWAGGRELVPQQAWRFPVRGRRHEGIYALQRPIFDARDVANAIERIWDWEASVGRVAVREYCRGSVAHLDWAALWGRWQAWIRGGL